MGLDASGKNFRGLGWTGCKTFALRWVGFQKSDPCPTLDWTWLKGKELANSVQSRLIQFTRPVRGFEQEAYPRGCKGIYTTKIDVTTDAERVANLANVNIWF